MRRFLFELKENMAIAFRAVVSNKMRAVLTTLGIIIGIISVTGMATVVNGIERGFEQDIASLGTDVIYIERWPWVTGPGFKWWEYINRPRITEDIAEALNEKARLVEEATAVVSTVRPISYDGNQVAGSAIRGTFPNYPMVHELDLSDGYYFSEFENQSARNVAVIGAGLADELFPIQEPLGKDIKIMGSRFLVIGIVARQGSGSEGGSSEDYEVRIPFKTFQKEFGTRWRDVSVRAKVAPGVAIADAKDEIRGITRVVRKLDAKEEDDFTLNEQETLRATIAPIKTAIYSIGLGLTALALLVGGIGVMNIMFVTVKERTREIGIRKAVGAKRSTILGQFLIEAVLICLVGGIIGIMFSIPLSMLIKAVLPAYLDSTVVMVAFVICVLIGTVFGLAPAWTAAKSHPIEALRYE